MFPKGIGNLGNMANMMKQVMEIKGKIEAIKEELAHETVEASSGGGLVTVVINGKQEVLSVAIDPAIIDREDPETLQTLVKAAFNDAVRKTKEMMKARMEEVTGGLDIPGLSDT